MKSLKRSSILKRLDNERGSLLLIAYFVILVLLGIGASFIMIAVNESQVAERQRLSVLAFHTAEAGLERGLYDLRMDFVNTVDPSWSDGDINGYAIGPDTNNFYKIPYSSTSLNGGSYSVQLKNILGRDDVWLRSEGTVNDVTHTIDVYVRMVDLSPWDNAIFAGSGASGSMINGNVDIRGSVLILGSGLGSTDYAMDLGGTAEIVGNNYVGLESGLLAKVPALPTMDFNGEIVSTLNAELRVRRGIVGISGSSQVGQPDQTGNGVKETVDGVYVTDGFGGTQGTNNVYSDNGTSNSYDLGDSVVFPSLSDPYLTYATYLDYLRANAYVVNASEAAQLASVTPSSSFSIGNATGSITMDGAGNMTVDGIVFIDSGGSFGTAGSGSNKTITYTGSGSLVVTGNVQINTSLVTAGNNSFPNNILGIMTPNNINFNEAQINVMGLFYGENTITVQKQTDMVGTIVSNYFNMGTNVPAIYQVPDTINHLPPGMIGANKKWYRVSTWMKF